MDGVTKSEQRVLTIVGVVVGILIGFVVFQKVIGNRMIEAPKFVLAVFLGGIVGMVLYTAIKDGGIALLNRRGAPKRATTDPEPVLATSGEPEATPAPVKKAPRREPLKAKPRPVKAAAKNRPAKKQGGSSR